MQIEPGDNQTEAASNARREALRKIAVFGAYTAPVMLGRLTASKTASASTIPDRSGSGGGAGGLPASFD